MVTKWTNIKSVLFELERFIPKDIYSEARLIEDCMRAVNMIGAVPTYQVNIAYYEVNNHKFCLPNDCLQIVQVAYRENPNLCQQDVEDLQDATRIFPQDDFIGTSSIPFQIWFDGWSQKGGWRPLRLSTNTFAQAVHCSTSRNLNCSCEHSYTVDPSGIITTSAKKCLIMVAYYRYPKDCDGNYLIPDIDSYKECLKNFCLMNLWEFRWNTKEEGAGERYQKYQQLFGLYLAKASADLRMPSLDEANNMKNILNKLIPNNRRFENFFTGMGNNENLDFKGFSAHYAYR